MTTPITSGLDVEALRYYTAESFYNRAANLNLEIIQYTETDVDAKQVSAEFVKQFPDATWKRFEAICKYPDDIEALLNENYGEKD